MGRPKNKNFRLPADQMVRMVPNLGACFATDRITVDGCPVGYMYREEPDDDVDSGWRFVAGDESQSYMDDPNNSLIYDVNTIANYDPEILEFLSYPVGTSIVRQAGRLMVEHGPSEPPPVRFMTPVPEGAFQLADDLVLTAPCHLLRRLDHGDLVLWRPGLTMRCRFGRSSTPSAVQLETILAAASRDRFEEQRDEIGRYLRLSYRLDEHNPRGIQPALYGFLFSDTRRIDIALYFDNPEAEARARALWESIEVVSGRTPSMR